MLRAKAMLLLRREKEVFELRSERTRNEAWLQAFHKISVDLRGQTAATLLDHWVAAMIEDIKFQIAAACRADTAARTLILIASQAPSALPSTVTVDDPSVWDHLRQGPGGSARELPPAVREILGGRIGL